MDELHFLRVFFEHLLKQTQHPRAVRSLIVVENSNHHRRRSPPLKRGTRDVDVTDKVDRDDFHCPVLPAC
jgi:hypothetical protein